MGKSTCKNLISILFGVSIFFSSCEREYNYFSVSPSSDPIYKSGLAYQSNITPSSSALGKKFYLCKAWGVLQNHPTIKNQELEGVLENFLIKVDTLSINVFKTELNRLIIPFSNKITHLEIDSSLLKDHLNLSLFWLSDTTYISPETASRLYNIIYTYNVNRSSNSLLKQSNIGLVKYKRNCCPNSSGEVPTKTQRLIGLFHYWNFIEYYYPYKNLIDDNWDQVLLDNLNSFEQSETEEEYKLAIIKLISSIDDNHSIIHPLNLTSVFGEYVANFRMVKIDSTFVVKKIRSKQENLGEIMVGDIILSIDSIEISKLSDSLNAYATGGNIESKNRELNKLLLCKKEKNHKIKIKRNGTIFEKDVTFLNYSDLNKSERKEQRFWDDKNIVKEIESGIGYVNLNHLFEDNIVSNLSSLHQFKKGVIIDMRGYPNAYTSSKLLNFVVQKDTSMFCSIYPDINRPGLFRLQKNNSVIRITGDSTYKGPIAVLVDESTQSHAEFLVMAMQSNPNVSVIGNASAGSDGNVSSFTFPGDIEVKLSGIGILYPDLSPTQRTGVKIDFQVPYSLSDIRAEKDPWIEKGAAFLLSLKKSEKQTAYSSRK